MTSSDPSDENESLPTQEDNDLERLLEEFSALEEDLILTVWRSSQSNYENARMMLKSFADSQNDLENESADAPAADTTQSDPTPWSYLSKNEQKLIQESVARIIWNILYEPTQSKYRRISSAALNAFLSGKCRQQKIRSEAVLTVVEKLLQDIGFKKTNRFWEYESTTEAMKLWNYYRIVLDNHKYLVPEQMWMSLDDTWKQYYVAIDFDQKSVALLDSQNTQTAISLQICKSNSTEKDKDKNKDKDKEKVSDVLVESWNDFSEVDISETKWRGVTINKTWKFRTVSRLDIRDFRRHLTFFNPFRVRWRKVDYSAYDYVTINPYTMTLQESLDRIQQEFKVRQRFINGMDEIIAFELLFENCEPSILEMSKEVMKVVTLHDIYKNIHKYPEITITWIVKSFEMVEYDRTIGVKSDDGIEMDKTETQEEKIETESPIKNKHQFNPFLYHSDADKFVQHELISLNEFSEVLAKDENINNLKALLHEIIKNGYLCDLIEVSNMKENISQNEIEEIKQKIEYDDEKWQTLKLDEDILKILKEVKQLFHSPIHKHMGYPLQLSYICAILLYCGRSCHMQFCKDQIQFYYHKWKWLDYCLHNAVFILSKHERREEFDEYLYCGLSDVKFESLELSENAEQESDGIKKIKEIREGYFISYISAFKDLQIAQKSRGEKGCILKFHPSVRRAHNIDSCDIGWISPYKSNHETLFTRSYAEMAKSFTDTWNAHIESEDSTTQVIMLTWSEYDKYYMAILQISAIFNRLIDHNVIWGLLKLSDKSTMKPVETLVEFEEWKKNTNNVSEYMNGMKNIFQNRRCWNHQFNLLCIFLEDSSYKLRMKAIDWATIITVNGLPWWEEDRLESVETT